MRKNNRRAFLAGAGAFAATAVPLAVVSAAPNGTRPTLLSDLTATSTSRSQMRVTGRFTTLSGQGIPGMPIKIYTVGDFVFVLAATVYTDGNGGFSASMYKPQPGTKFQVEAEGNGQFSRPWPVLNMP